MRALYEIDQDTLISPLNSWLLSKVKKVTKATPERRGYKEYKAKKAIPAQPELTVRQERTPQ